MRGAKEDASKTKADKKSQPAQKKKRVVKTKNLDNEFDLSSAKTAEQAPTTKKRVNKRKKKTLHVDRTMADDTFDSRTKSKGTGRKVRKPFQRSDKEAPEPTGKKGGTKRKHGATTTQTTGTAHKTGAEVVTDNKEDELSIPKARWIKDEKGGEVDPAGGPSPRKKLKTDTTAAENDGTAAARAEVGGAESPHAGATDAVGPTGRIVTAAAKKAMDDFATTAFNTGVHGFRKEFEELQGFKGDDLPHKAFTANMERNRYKFVICQDATRVVLKFNVPPSTDYVHANWIKADNSDTTFIATQGPLESTIPDFWRMCYQESVLTILMLCNIMESGKQKCAQYWPQDPNTETKYDLITVRNKKVVADERFHTTSLLLTVEDSMEPSLHIELINMTSWPDKGVPASSTHVLRMIKRIQKGGPCVVHCSAGIGRTGTAVAVAVTIDRLFNGSAVNLKELVKELRKMRAFFVQTEAQYVFVVSSALEYIKAKMPGVYDKQIKSFNKEVVKACLD